MVKNGKGLKNMRTTINDNNNYSNNDININNQNFKPKESNQKEMNIESKMKVKEQKEEQKKGQKGMHNEKIPEAQNNDKKTLENLLPIFFMALLFVISIGFALFLAPIYSGLGFQADFEELGGEESLWIPVFYIVLILVFTAIILLITRRRRGGFIKYGFLGIICLSMIYVFAAIFSVLLFPIPDQQWSNEVSTDSDVNSILVGDLLGDSDNEIIVGLSDRNVQVYDNDFQLLSQSPTLASGAISDLAISDLRTVNESSQSNKLIIVTNDIIILDHGTVGGKYTLDILWQFNSNLNSRYSKVEVVTLPPFKYNLGSGSNQQIFFGSNNDLTGNGQIQVLIEVNSTFQLTSWLDLSYPIHSLSSGWLNRSEFGLFIGTNGGVYFINYNDPNNSEVKLFDTIGNNVIGLQVKDIDYKGNNEIIAWDESGLIHIYEGTDKKIIIDTHEDSRIGGLELYEIFSGNDHMELVVSSEGKVYIYYSYKELLDEKYEFTEETGRLNKLATGVAVGLLDNNNDPDILIGFETGFKRFEYEQYKLSDTPCFIGLFVAVILTIFLFKHPEWYIVDIVGIIVAGGVTALLGISIGLLPLILLLMVLAIYDAISVYKTKHMVSLADKVMEFKLPILLVVPKKRGYSFIEQKGLKKQLDDGEEREAMFIGLGDIIIPGALVVSSFFYLSETPSFMGIGGNLLVAIFTLVGVLFGFSVLMQYVLKGNPQAGLPLLNTGAILGFFISNFIIYQDITFGLTLPFG